MIVPRHVLGGVGYHAPSDTVNFAMLGCGEQGKTDAVELVIGGWNLVALADVDFTYVDREVAARTKVREFRPPSGPNAPRMSEQATERMKWGLPATAPILIKPTAS